MLKDINFYFMNEDTVKLGKLNDNSLNILLLSTHNNLDIVYRRGSYKITYNTKDCKHVIYKKTQKEVIEVVEHFISIAERLDKLF